MKLNQAISERLAELLKEKKMNAVSVVYEEWRAEVDDRQRN